MTEYWFARRFPGHPRNAMAPARWKGFTMFGVFIAALLIGALGLLFAALSGNLAWGVAVFAAMAVAGAGGLLLVVSARGDKMQTIEDYRKKNA